MHSYNYTYNSILKQSAGLPSALISCNGIIKPGSKLKLFQVGWEPPSLRCERQPGVHSSLRRERRFIHKRTMRTLSDGTMKHALTLWLHAAHLASFHLRGFSQSSFILLYTCTDMFIRGLLGNYRGPLIKLSRHDAQASFMPYGSATRQI